MQTFDFSTLIAEHSANFVGRDWLLTLVDNFLESSKNRFLIITGEPGIGKTAFAANLCITRRINAHHFCQTYSGGTLDSLSFVYSINEQLKKSLPDYSRYLLDPQYIQINANQTIKEMKGGTAFNIFIDKLPDRYSPFAAYESLIRRPLQQWAKDHQSFGPVVLLVDALDESISNEYSPNIYEIIVSSDDLPECVRWIITSRPNFKLEGLGGQCIRLTANSEENTKDISKYLRMRMARIKNFTEMKHDAQMKLILEEKSGGNFLFLKYALEQILDEPDIDLTILINELPTGLNEIYARFIANAIKNRSSGEWLNLYAPVLGILCVAREGFSKKEIARISGLDIQSVHKVLTEISSLIKKTEVKDSQYSLYHVSFAEFLQDQSGNPEYWIDPSKYHNRIAQYYLLEANWNEGYALRNLGYHLQISKNLEDFRRLLFSKKWQTVQLSHDYSLGWYLNDLDRLFNILQQYGKKEIQDLVVISLLYSGILSRASVIPAEILRAFVLFGAIKEASDNADLIMDVSQRIIAYTAILDEILHQRTVDLEVVESLLKKAILDLNEKIEEDSFIDATESIASVLCLYDNYDHSNYLWSLLEDRCSHHKQDIVAITTMSCLVEYYARSGHDDDATRLLNINFERIKMNFENGFRSSKQARHLGRLAEALVWHSNAQHNFDQLVNILGNEDKRFRVYFIEKLTDCLTRAHSNDTNLNISSFLLEIKSWVDDAFDGFSVLTTVNALCCLASAFYYVGFNSEARECINKAIAISWEKYSPSLLEEMTIDIFAPWISSIIEQRYYGLEKIALTQAKMGHLKRAIRTIEHIKDKTGTHMISALCSISNYLLLNGDQHNAIILMDKVQKIINSNKTFTLSLRLLTRQSSYNERLMEGYRNAIIAFINLGIKSNNNDYIIRAIELMNKLQHYRELPDLIISVIELVQTENEYKFLQILVRSFSIANTPFDTARIFGATAITQFKLGKFDDSKSSLQKALSYLGAFLIPTNLWERDLPIIKDNLLSHKRRKNRNTVEYWLLRLIRNYWESDQIKKDIRNETNQEKVAILKLMLSAKNIMQKTGNVEGGQKQLRKALEIFQRSELDDLNLILFLAWYMAHAFDYKGLDELYQFSKNRIHTINYDDELIAGIGQAMVYCNYWDGLSRLINSLHFWGDEYFNQHMVEGIKHIAYILMSAQKIDQYFDLLRTIQRLNHFSERISAFDYVSSAFSNANMITNEAMVRFVQDSLSYVRVRGREETFYCVISLTPVFKKLSLSRKIYESLESLTSVETNSEGNS